MELGDWVAAGAECLLEQDDVGLCVCDGLLEGAEAGGEAVDVPLEDGQVAGVSSGRGLLRSC